MSSPLFHGPESSSGDLYYCVEVDVMVAKERVHYSYGAGAGDAWACPANEPDPYARILRRFQRVLALHDEMAVVRDEEDGSAFVPAESWSWVVRPSRWATPRPGCPRNYHWYPVRLRTPFVLATALLHRQLELGLRFGALRRSIRQHVNGSCQFNVFVRTGFQAISLTMAKKLVTAVWLMERELLLRLSPILDSCNYGPEPPLSSCAVVSTRRLVGLKASRPPDLDLAADMDRHLPVLGDKVAQERLQRLWASRTLDELSRAIRDASQSPLAFSLEMSRSEERGFRCMAVFRYALWHPYDNLDASSFWTKLALAFCRIMYVEHERFKRWVRTTVDIIHGFGSYDVESDARWKILLERLGLDEYWYEPWQVIVHEYLPGGRLSSYNIDRHPSLSPQMPGMPWLTWPTVPLL